MDMSFWGLGAECHSLDLEDLLKVHVLEHGVQPVVLLGSGGTFRRKGRNYERKLGHWGQAFAGAIETPFSLLSSYCEINRSPPPFASTIMYCAATGPKQQGQVTMD
jgi:hypothetical protein